MTATDYQNATRQGSVDELLAPDPAARKPVPAIACSNPRPRWPGSSAADGWTPLETHRVVDNAFG